VLISDIPIFPPKTPSLPHLYHVKQLMHWPQAQKDGKWVPKSDSPTFVETWKSFEKLLDSGKVRSIG
jgi:diketogulonate reductase-like aldo/keto reductase